LWPFFVLGGAAALPAAAVVLFWACVFAWRKKWGLAGFALGLSPLFLVMTWLLLQVACVARVVVVDLSSPQNEFRARTIVRDAGATTSWGVVVEVGSRGWVGWNWEPVFRTYRDIPAEVSWRDATTLVIRHHRSDHAKRLTQAVGTVSVVFEECPRRSENAPSAGPYLNSC
jgi:hypothetical protein